MYGHFLWLGRFIQGTDDPGQKWHRYMQVSFRRTAYCVLSRQHHIFVSGVIQTDSCRVPIGLVGLEA